MRGADPRIRAIGTAEILLLQIRVFASTCSSGPRPRAGAVSIQKRADPSGGCPRGRRSTRHRGVCGSRSARRWSWIPLTRGSWGRLPASFATSRAQALERALARARGRGPGSSRALFQILGDDSAAERQRVSDGCPRAVYLDVDTTNAVWNFCLQSIFCCWFSIRERWLECADVDSRRADRCPPT